MEEGLGENRDDDRSLRRSGRPLAPISGVDPGAPGGGGDLRKNISPVFPRRCTTRAPAGSASA